MSNPDTSVVNLRDSPFDIYIGRACPRKGLPASKWANPFIVGRHGARGECVDLFEDWILTQPQLLAQLPELKGKTLGCWCKPRRCHGDVLIRLLKRWEAGELRSTPISLPGQRQLF